MPGTVFNFFQNSPILSVVQKPQQYVHIQVQKKSLLVIPVYRVHFIKFAKLHNYFRFQCQNGLTCSYIQGAFKIIRNILIILF